jgi:L-amino acid N-acyltransferase YncA
MGKTMHLIRTAIPADAEAIRSIYAPSVTRHDVATSFEVDVPSVAEIARRVERISARFPWLVMEDHGQVIGYAYADSHRERAAYQWSAEVSVYIGDEHHRRGVGRGLYQSLFRLLCEQGIVNLYAGITLPNTVYRSVGFKFGRPHDVGWWHLALQPWPRAPLPPTPPPATVDLKS